MYTKKLFLCFFVFTFTAPVFGNELSPAHRLRKLSLHLKGMPPTLEEYRALEQVTPLAISEFLHKKTREYLASPHHVGKMIGRVDSLFRLRTARGLPETRLLTPEKEPPPPGRETVNGFDLLVATMVEKNQSWDTLLHTPSYTLYKSAEDFVFSDGNFLRVVAPDHIPKTPGYFNMEIDKGDPRFAGALTTARFFARYSTTNVNRNRGRAAAIFRIFLCDDMRAVVEPSAEEEDELLKKVFPKEPADGYHRGLRVGNDPHASQESCRACHYKLDPLGKAFLSSGAVLSDEPAPGRLTFRREDGTLVDAPGKGVGELATAILAQPEYARCQVSHFWKWFIRGDREPSEKRMEELLAAFESSGRRVNEFIAYLVNQPEFFQDPPVQTPTVLDVKPMLQRCNSCHAGLTSKTIPNLSQLPIGGTEKNHIKWVKRIVTELDLPHNGKNRTMPPKESAWQPSPKEIQMFKAWVAGGVQNENHEKTVDENLAQGLLELSGPLVPKVETGFQDSFQRYLSGSDVFRTLSSKFPSVEFKQDNICQALSDKNRAALGDPNPFNGELIYHRPSLAFVRWYGGCVLKWIQAEIEAEKKTSLALLFGPEATGLLKETGLDSVLKEINTPWKVLSAEVQKAIVAHQVRYYFGTGILKNEREFTEKLFSIASQQYSELPLEKVLVKTIFFVMTQNEFLTY